MSKRLQRLLALMLALAMIAASCGSSDDAADGDDGDSGTTTTTEQADDGDSGDADDGDSGDSDDAPAAEATGGGDDQLVIGTILPVTGDLAFLGPAEIAGSELAVRDINEAGGVFGTPVVLVQGDSGDTTTDTASVEVDRLLAEGADAILGAASSAVSKTVIDKITGAGVIQFSPANTSPDFTTYDDNGLYFRTAPSDLLQGRVLSDAVLEQGNETASVIFRQESYGVGLADAFRDNFEGSGGIIDEFIGYAVDVESFDAEVDSIATAGSDAIIVIGFAESANIVTTMHERGVGPTSGTNVWGVDGNASLNGELADPSILEGMKQTIPSVDLGSISDFISRLETEMGGPEETAYGAETYDSVVIVALAAAVAGSDGGAAIAAEVNDVTRGGTKCTSFGECIALVNAGEDIDYDGLGGPYEFVEAGEPAAASFRIDTYGADGAEGDLAEYVFAGASAAPAPAGDAAASGDELVIGTILPVTGDLAFLGPAEIAGSELAVRDINEAGGVFGTPVVLVQGDSGDTTTDTASVEVDRLLAEGADAILGAASSAVSKTVIDKITGAGVIQFSPANTSPDFTTYDDNGLYFRTAPSDLLQGRVLSNAVLDQGNESASVIFRQESYGVGLADAFRDNFEGSGGIIDEFIGYAVDVESFDAEVDSLTSAGSDAIIVIGFAESANIVTTMHERGIGPTSGTNVWGVDGNASLNGELADPSILEGMMQTIPSVDLGSISDFISRLETEMGGPEETAYGAETYDSVVIVALAAAVAGSDGGAAIAAEVNDVTRGGTKCTSFGECIALVNAGEDIDYDGFGGPYEFVEAGEPAAASFRIDTYGADGAEGDLAQYVFAS